MKVAFAGTPEFALASLCGLHAGGFDVMLVLTQPDRAAGRGMKLRASPVKVYALEHGLPLAQPRSLRLDGKFPDDARAAHQALLDAQPDVLVVAAYGLILPVWVLELPRLGCINVHASLLPRWRGAAPIQRAIEAGDMSTGVTLMQMDAGLDTGDMLLAESVDIIPDDTAATLQDRLGGLGARLLVQTLNLAAAGALARTPQPAQGMTYAHKIEKHEAAVDWSQPAQMIERRLRAFDPFPGASASLDGEPLKLWRARVADAGGEPGRVLCAAGDRLTVACGSGALDIVELQCAGGRRVSAQQFLQGRAGLAGKQFDVGHSPPPRSG